MRLIVYSILNALINQMGTIEAYDIMRDLKDCILGDAKGVAEEIEDSIRNNARSECVCPECGSELETKAYKEGSEYMGFDTYEDIIELYCPICGWEE